METFSTIKEMTKSLQIFGRSKVNKFFEVSKILSDIYHYVIRKIFRLKKVRLFLGLLFDFFLPILSVRNTSDKMVAFSPVNTFSLNDHFKGKQGHSASRFDVCKTEGCHRLKSLEYMLW